MPIPLPLLFLLAGGGAAAGAYAGKKGMLKPQQMSSLDKNQQGIYGAQSDAIMGKGGPLGDLYDFNPDELREMFDQAYAQPAYQNFQENIVPGITGSFRGNNLQNSSYLGGALSKAGTDVQKDLDANLSKMLYQAKQDSLNRKSKGVSDILGMQTFAYKDSPLMQLLQALGSGAGKALGAKFGGG